jgi:3-dehydroquinate synthase
VETLDVALRPWPRPQCRIRVGSGALESLVAEFAVSHADRRLALVTDANVLPLHAARLAELLAPVVRHVEVIAIPAGEASKTRESKAAIEDRLLAAAIGRRDLLLAVGGGMVGDLAGFVAATWHRGIEWVQVPTTLLAMVDASLGGKTAVNLAEAKNLVGCFHHPTAVFADVETLRTLPEREYLAGFAEVVKAAAIADREFFEQLEVDGEGLVRREATLLERTIVRSMRIKLDIVEQDAQELGRRAALNFGHTVAHAVELQPRRAQSSPSRWNHGEAVAFGMSVEGALAHSVHGFPADELRRLQALLRRFGLPTVAPRELDPLDIVAAARTDKKNRGGRIHFALPLRIGAMPAGDDVTLPLDEALLLQALQRAAGVD